MDGIQELIADHARLRDLFSAVELASSKEAIEDFYVELRVQFEIHGSVELEALWPVARKHLETGQVDEDWEEIRVLFGRLDEHEIGTERWSKTFQTLRRRSLSHFETEEKEMFAAVFQKLSEAELESMSEHISQTKNRYSPN